jgi:hypothetical protein
MRQLDSTQALLKAVMGKKTQRVNQFEQVVAAFQKGQTDIVVELPWYPDGGTHQIILQRIQNSRAFFINPLGHGKLPVGAELTDGQPRRVEAGGLESMPVASLERLFKEGKTQAAIPV